MRKVFTIALLWGLCFAPFHPVLAEETPSYSIAGFDDGEKVKSFVEHLRQLATQDKREEIAALIRFPLNIIVAGHRIALRNRRDFLKHYDQAFNAKVKEALARQDSSNLFANWQGAMIGNGEIWLRPSPKSPFVQIIAINN
ncbi:MAG: hypothetical protein U1F57_10555 [bacterium]